MNIHFRTFLVSLIISSIFFGCYALRSDDIGEDINYFEQTAVIDLPCDQKLIPSDELIMMTRPVRKNELATTHNEGNHVIRESLCGIDFTGN